MVVNTSVLYTFTKIWRVIHGDTKKSKLNVAVLLAVSGDISSN